MCKLNNSVSLVVVAGFHYHLLAQHLAKLIVLNLKLIYICGGAEGDRTPDLMTASHALSQLSYSPNKNWLNNEIVRICQWLFLNNLIF
jgi:hypothetical protein